MPHPFSIRFFLLAFLCFVFYTVSAQKANINRLDSIYYLLDTANKMWSVSIDSSVMSKNYTIQCPCLINGGKPKFSYSISNASKEKGITISNKKLKTIELVNLNSLILKTKEVDSTNNWNRY